MEVKRYDFSEPQHGKDVCDRIICPLKASLRKFCDEGNDITSAVKMKGALSAHPVKGTLSSVNKVNDSVIHLETKKIKHFSNYHNFKFDGQGITVWKAYAVGKGKRLKSQDIYKTHQEPTSIEVIQCFEENEGAGRALKVTKPESTNVAQDLFECDEAGCNYTFSSFEDLELHMEIGTHNRFVENESVYDTLRREWVKKLTTIDEGAVSSVDERQNRGSTHTRVGGNLLPMGWALSRRSPSERFSQNVRDYLQIIYDLGEKTGEKAEPAQVAQDMRGVQREDGSRRFAREEWLTAAQIKGFFSRVTRQRRKGKSRSDTAQHLTESDSEDEEQDDSRNDLVNEIHSELALKHPIVYQMYDLCDCVKENKLSLFKVAMLREICGHFELPMKSRDKKAILIEHVVNMVQDCSCQDNS